MSRPEPLSSLLQQALNGPQPNRREVLYDVQERWAALVGADAARRSFPKTIRGKTLFVSVPSAAWAQELSFMSHDLVSRLSQELPYAGIGQIRFEIH